jgi:RHS repeat-associated protein
MASYFDNSVGILGDGLRGYHLIKPTVDSLNPSNLTTFKGVSHSFNADHQVTAIAYNSRGSPTARNGNALIFDPYNQLTAYGSLLTAGYTGDGLRATKTTSGGTTAFLYDGSQPVLEMTWNGTVLGVNTFGPNGLLSRRSGGASTFYQFDPQGSVAQRLNSAGTVLSSDMYDAYGVGQSTAAPSDPWGYGAQWGYFTDRETGLVLLTHRYYDPSAGRFLNRDPIGVAGGLNLYGYTGNNSVNRADPRGPLCRSLDQRWRHGQLPNPCWQLARTDGSLRGVLSPER